MYIYHEGEKIRVISDSRLEMPALEELKIRALFSKPSDLMKEYKVRNGRLVSKRKQVSGDRLKIAMVGVWDIPCGIATYTRFLVDELREANHQVHTFAEHSDSENSDPHVTHCWKRGESLRELTARLKDYDPDVIYIQHEYGVFPDARKWTTFIADIQDYNYHVVLHSVYRHKDKVVCEAICKSIIVHSEIARTVLREKGIAGDIHVVPHGCCIGRETSRLWNIYRSQRTVMQFGFGFEYKGWDVALDAIRILKDKYPDVFYLILFSESSFSKDFHDSQFEKIIQLIEDKSLSENVAVVRGFQTDESLNSFLRTARVAIFPYTSHPEHVVYGSSGAVRIAMAHGTPVVVSTVPLFSDLEGVVPRASGAEELAIEIDALFSSKAHYDQVVQNELEFTKENSWQRVARKYTDLV